MARQDWAARPASWPDWIPPRCENGHPQVPGKVANHWVNHPGCPANNGPAGDGRGHHVVTCEATIGCHDVHRPPDCSCGD